MDCKDILTCTDAVKVRDPDPCLSLSLTPAMSYDINHIICGFVDRSLCGMFREYKNKGHTCPRTCRVDLHLTL